MSFATGSRVRPNVPESERHWLRSRRLRWLLNILVVVLLLLVVYFVAGVPIVESVGGDSDRAFSPAGKPIQIDVLNGCGVNGVASKVTTYLRRRGFDVVEIRNYKSFEIRQTLVVDRVGKLETARQVARALGVKPGNIIQEINPDYFVDVSVVVGRDYPTLMNRE